METVDLRDSYDHDFVAVIRCDDKRGWPSTNLIHQCMVSECHVVLVGHTMSPIYKKWKQWCISFISASLKLAHSFSIKHRQAFIIYKLLIKETIVTESTTYQINIISWNINIFHWLCEEKMSSGNIFEDMSDIITKLLYFFRQKYTPDYVIFIKICSKQYYSSHWWYVSIPFS